LYQGSSSDLESALVLGLVRFQTDLFIDNPDSGHINPILSQHFFDPYSIAPHVSIQDDIRSCFSERVSLVRSLSAGAFGQAGGRDGFARPDNVREIEELVNV
jgi:hypothetical protein